MTLTQPFSGVVALDGPSGTGKSTVARRLAVRLSTRYLDTGAMYRAATLAALSAGIDLRDAHAVTAVVAQAVISVATDPQNAATTLDGRRVDVDIRDSAVTSSVSVVSAIAEVRAQLTEAQRRLIGPGGIVVEGRDIGTVVWPEARPKVYLTADVLARARRRAAEQGSEQIEEVAVAIAGRDAYDSSRAVSPLRRAPDAIELDTTYLSIDEVVQRLVDITTAVMIES